MKGRRAFVITTTSAAYDNGGDSTDLLDIQRTSASTARAQSTRMVYVFVVRESAHTPFCNPSTRTVGNTWYQSGNGNGAVNVASNRAQER